MLTKKDLLKIDEIVNNGFQKFYESIFEPYATANEKAHEEIKKELGDKIDTLAEFIKDHEKRIRRLEIRTGL